MFKKQSTEVKIDNVYKCKYYDTYYIVKYIRPDGKFTAVPFEKGAPIYIHMLYFCPDGLEVVRDESECPYGYTMDLDLKYIYEL